MVWVMLAVLCAQAEEIIRLTRSFTSVYAVVGEEGVVLVDAHYPDRQDWIWRKLARQDIAPEDIALVVLTHAHSDHAGSAAALQRAGLRVAAGAGDAGMATSGDHGTPLPTDWRGQLILSRIEAGYEAFVPDVLIEDTLDLRPYGVAGHAQVVGGHSSGSLVIVLPQGQVLVGDLLRSRLALRHRPTLHFFHDEVEVAHAALRALLAEGMQTAWMAHSHPVPARRVQRWLVRHD